MKINNISATNLNYKIFKQNNPKKKRNTNNSFQLLSVSSNAITANAIANISFKSSKNINTPEARKKEWELLVDSFNVYSDIMQVFKNLAPECAKEAKELYNLAKEDISTSPKDKRVTLEQTIWDGEIVPHKLLRKDSFGLPIYSASFEEGKISQIDEFDMSGNVSKIIKFNKETGDLISYQKNSDDQDKEYEFLIEYDSEYGINELAKYSEAPIKDKNGNTTFSRVIEFINFETLKRSEDVVTTPLGEEIEARRIFNFENLNTFDYCSSLKNGTEQGEKIRIENGNITKWE